MIETLFQKGEKDTWCNDLDLISAEIFLTINYMYRKEYMYNQKLPGIL